MIVGCWFWSPPPPFTPPNKRLFLEISPRPLPFSFHQFDGNSLCFTRLYPYFCSVPSHPFYFIHNPGSRIFFFFFFVCFFFSGVKKTPFCLHLLGTTPFPSRGQKSILPPPAQLSSSTPFGLSSSCPHDKSITETSPGDSLFSSFFCHMVTPPYYLGRSPSPSPILLFSN